MSLKTINERIQRVEPCVTLFKGEVYHYFEFDNVAPESTLTKPVYKVGDDLIYDTRSEMVPYTTQVRERLWIEWGILFGAEMRARHHLPAQGE